MVPDPAYGGQSPGFAVLHVLGQPATAQILPIRGAFGQECGSEWTANSQSRYVQVGILRDAPRDALRRTKRAGNPPSPRGIST